MKLKELHIRNIASIESADIDFEHGLNDAVTGDPASIFLISGDTGAGKSVILDGISMALYKKTPRIADVANVTKNDFTDTEGESIRVASIEQYTRLGISEKDDCYSEVVFEGNDGKTYHARLTLGISLGNTDKTTGIRPLKHKSPVWEIRIEDGDWTKDRVEQTISQAVGLDFKQFGRMAMLAQGQFAKFLTGDKKEREGILEQLTNTSHFTDYGVAIQSLWKKAKETQTTIQTQYDTEKPHTLNDEQVEQITKELTEAKGLFEKYGKDIEATEGKLKQVEAVLRNEKSMTEASQFKQELEAKMAGEVYKHSKALFTDWDGTTAQRHQLSDLIRARQDEAKARQDLSQARGTFSLLTADMADRQAKAKLQEDAIRQLEEQIAKQARHEELFTKAGETDLKIGQYLEKVNKAGILSAKLKQEKDNTEGLKKAESDAIALAQEAENTVKERQKQIDELSKKRSELNPQAVIEELKKQNSRKQELSDLQTSIDNLKPIKEENLTLKAKLQTEDETLKTLREAKDKADSDYQAQKETTEKAVQRLTTMKMSLDDKIKELRHRLYDEHTENCPLCGQHIEHIHLDDDFKDMLTPLEEEQRLAKESLKKAEGLRDKAMGDFKQLDGTHKSNLHLYEGNEKKIGQAQKAIDDKATQLGFDLQKDLSQQITEAISLLTVSISKLDAAQNEAELLQREINRLIQEKKPFDSNKTKADTAKLKAEAAVKANAEAISRMEKEKEEIVNDGEAIKAEVNAILSNYCDEWQKNTEEVRKRLKDDAKAYLDQQKLLSDRKTELEKNNRLLSTLVQYSEDIVRACPDWTANTSAQTYICRNINAEWTNLLSKVTSLVSKLQESKNVITSSEEILNAYYEETGKTEQTLKELMTKETEVAGARKLVNDIGAQLKSRIDAISEAERQIAAAFKALDITERTALPDKQVLEEYKASVSKQRDEALEKHTQAKSQLVLHEKNIKHLKKIEEELEKAKQRFARWDRLNNIFGGTRFRTLVQTYILRPLLNNANIYLEQITDRYRLTCSEANEQLSILVLDRYNKDQVRSVTVLSGGERFMISLALSLALSSLNRPDMNVNILFIDEGFGTLDEKSLDSVMSTLEKLQEIAGQTNRRVGVISHREELEERIPVKIQVIKKGEGRSNIEIHCQA